MRLHRKLAYGLLEAHPEDAARVLEALPEEEARLLLASVRASVACGTLRRMAPQKAASLLADLDRERAAAIVEDLGSDLAATILRRMQPQEREALLDSLETGPGRTLRTLLRFPAGTAGSLMDPNVMALPRDLSAEQAHAHIRASPQHVRYNLYVVDREQVLVGVLNLRELLLARRKDLLGSIARCEVFSLPAHADRHAILANPAWREARSVPVVDGRGVYLGAVRYHTLRMLEEQRHGTEPQDAAATAEALGDLFSTGIAGVFGALTASVARPLPDSEAP